MCPPGPSATTDAAADPRPDYLARLAAALVGPRRARWATGSRT